MQVLEAVNSHNENGSNREVFAAIEQRLKRVPNMLKLMGNSPAILAAYLKFNEAFDKTKMTPKMRGSITAAVAEANGCDYTLSVAYALGRVEGLSNDELDAARRGQSRDPGIAAALRFALTIVHERGRVPVSSVNEIRHAGFDDEELVEIIALVALNIFRNYFNLVGGTEIDFPLVKAHDRANGEDGLTPVRSAYQAMANQSFLKETESD